MFETKLVYFSLENQPDSFSNVEVSQEENNSLDSVAQLLQASSMGIRAVNNRLRLYEQRPATEHEIEDTMQNIQNLMTSLNRVREQKDRGVLAEDVLTATAYIGTLTTQLAQLKLIKVGLNS